MSGEAPRRRVTAMRIVERAVTGSVIVAGSALATTWLHGYGPGPGRLLAALVAIAIGLAGVVSSVMRPNDAPPRRLEAYLRATAVVLTSLLVLGVIYRLDDGPVRLTGSPLAGLEGLLVVLGLGSAFGEAAVLAVRVVGGRRRAPREPGSRPRRRMPYWLSVLILAALWAPAIVLLAPGSVTYDGMRQIDELLGVHIPSLGFTYVPTNHHPWFATVWQGSLLKAGMTMGHGSIVVGLLVHSAVLVVASLATYGTLVRRIQSLAGRGWGIVALAFFGIVPHFANYAMLYEKTGWYQIALIWFVLGVADLVLRSGSWWTVVLMVGGGGLLTSLFRSNGVYIVGATLVVLAIAELVRRRPRRALGIAGVLLVVIGAVAGWTSVALPRLGVEPASPGEALVIPFQQVGRIVKEHGGDLTPAQRSALDEAMPVDRIAAEYNSQNGDGIKGIYEIDTFLVTADGIQKMKSDPDWWTHDAYRAHLSAFLGAWAQLVLEHPGTAASATFDNTYLYVTPTLDRGDDVSLFTGGLTDYPVLANEYTPTYHHLLPEDAAGGLARYYSAWAALPGLELLANPGIYGWIVVALAISLLFWRRLNRLLLLTPVALIFLINFAGARNGDFRYTVAMLPVLALCLAAWWQSSSATAGDPVQRHVTVGEHEFEPSGVGADSDAPPELG